MARIRTIKPEFWEDEKIASLPIPCRLFYIGTWNLADDLGVIRANPAILKSKIFPYDDDLRVSEVKKWLDALIKARMLVPIIHQEESYYVIRTFGSHQKIDKRYGKPLIEEAVLNQLLNNIVEDTTGTHCVHTVCTPQEKERKGIGINTPLPPKGESAGKKDFDFSFVEDGFRDAFFEWISYKKSRNQAYKSQTSLEVCYRNLKKLAGGVPNSAKLVVEQSIGNNWNGLFELKKPKNDANSRIFIPQGIVYEGDTI